MLDQAIILSLIQALTEFLPVSSSGHLLLAEKIFDFSKFNLTFDVLVHLASCMALIIVFSKNWVAIFKQAKTNFSSSLLFKICIALIPAVVLGLILEKTKPFFWRSAYLVVFNLIFFGLILFWADFKKGKNRIKKLTLKNAFLIGLGQALALMPGVSRSGITISLALFLGLSRRESAKFSFLLATPAILGASLLELPKISYSEINLLPAYILGFITSFIFSYLVISWFLKYLKEGRLWPFVVWRVIIALGVLSILI